MEKNTGELLFIMKMISVCEICNKKSKNWYMVSGKYFCCLKHLEEFENAVIIKKRKQNYLKEEL